MKPKVITAELLRRLGGSCAEVDRFEWDYPSGFVPTQEGLLTLAQEGYNLDWAAQRLLPPQLLEEYLRQKAPFRAEFKRQAAPFRAEYHRQAAPFREEYERQVAPFEAEFERQVAPFGAEYHRHLALVLWDMWKGWLA